MSTTTIRLPEDLKARVARAAQRAGTTSHAFILEAIAEKTDAQDRRTDFQGLAEQRYAHIIASGESVSWDEMRGYLQQRLGGKAAIRPNPRKTTR